MENAGKFIGAGLAAFGLAGAGIGVGLVFASNIYSLARNPSQSAELFKLAILGFAITESLGLFALMVSFVILYS